MYYYRYILWLSCVCVCVCVSFRSFLPSRASRPRNIVTYVFTATRKTLIYIYSYYNHNFLLKMLRSKATASFACLECIFCPKLLHGHQAIALNRELHDEWLSVLFRSIMPLTTPKPQNTDTNGIHATWA